MSRAETRRRMTALVRQCHKGTLLQGRTRSAQNRAVSGPAVPVPHVIVSQAVSGTDAARSVALRGSPTSGTVKTASPRIATP